MVIAKNYFELENCIYDLINGYYYQFKFEKTIFKLNKEDGSIKFRRGPKTKVILPSSEDLSIKEMIDEVINKYEEFK